MSIDGQFFKDRVQSLCKAIKQLNLEYDVALQEGLDLLKAHRINYGPKGSVNLVGLWWEWPSIHWDALRIGSTMNFMDTPNPGRVPNSALDGPALDAAITFVNELISLKVLVPPPHPL